MTLRAETCILIVEDDPGLLNQLKWCFEGYEIYTAEDRETAIAELRRHEPAVVLQDLGLPPDAEGVSEALLDAAQVYAAMIQNADATLVLADTSVWIEKFAGGRRAGVGWPGRRHR